MKRNFIYYIRFIDEDKSFFLLYQKNSLPIRESERGLILLPISHKLFMTKDLIVKFMLTKILKKFRTTIHINCGKGDFYIGCE